MTGPDRLPEREEAVRRLLADSRHDEPAPPEVVARLDSVLADLAAQRRDTTPVVALGAVRRRRRAASLLLAAAAVVVAGVGLDQVRTPAGEDASTAGDADSEVFRAPSGNGSLLDRRPAPRTLVPEDGTAPLSSESLRTDLLRARGRMPEPGATASTQLPCDVPGAGDRVAVTFDGDVGVAVFGALRGDRQRVDVFVCGEPDPVRTVRLPAP